MRSFGFVMRKFGICPAIEKSINEVNEQLGVSEKVRLVPCDVVRICANGSHKDVVSGKFTR